MKKRQDSSFGILMYHRVTPLVSGMARPTWNVAPDRFRRQLTGLLARGYRPWPLHQALQYRAAGKPIPPRTFVVTFDDGYQCVYRNAWPILRELSIPATVFMVTSYLDADGPMSCDDWSAAGSAQTPSDAWKPLSTAECSAMLEDGLVEIGSHTHMHNDYRGHPGDFQLDLERSANVLRNAFGLMKPTFAFPYGYFDADLVAIVRQSGMACALTVDQELVPPEADPFSWGRLTVHEHDTATTLDFKLRGWYTVLRNARRWLQSFSRITNKPLAASHQFNSPIIPSKRAISP
jgi:peptidoglycan/xylan/chitin deacetylase (PgdA/CDA1 family)